MTANNRPWAKRTDVSEADAQADADNVMRETAAEVLDGIMEEFKDSQPLEYSNYQRLRESGWMASA
jgi:hypothetical protein